MVVNAVKQAISLGRQRDGKRDSIHALQRCLRRLTINSDGKGGGACANGEL